MVQTNTPNIIELYEGATQYILPILRGIKPEQLANATPCSEWNVQSLINHQIKVADYLHTVIGESGSLDYTSMFSVAGPLPSEGAEAAFAASSKRVLSALAIPGAVDKVVETGMPSGAIPAGMFAMFPFMDIVVHQWDLAKATNQNTSMDSSLAEAAYNILAPAVEGARKGGAFGPEVQVPINASIQDKLLGLSGRQY